MKLTNPDDLLNSQEWCDIIFDQKNKAYGAYELRTTSSQRHLWGIGLVAAVVALVIIVLRLPDVIAPGKQADRVTEVNEMTEVQIKDQIKPKPIEQKPPEEKPPEPKPKTEPVNNISGITNHISNSGSSSSSKSQSPEDQPADKPASVDSRLNSGLKDNRTDAKRVYDDAAAVQERMRANRAKYEQGLADIAAMKSGGSGGSGGGSDKTGTGSGSGQPGGGGGDSKVKGKVTVSFSLINPLRTSVRLVIPAYLCQGGGEITINITVSRDGRVIAASAATKADECITSSALKAAQDSRFNTDPSAPEKQKGTITYIFMAQ